MAFSTISLKPYGVSVDTNPLDVDETVWTHVSNVRFDNLTARKFRGEEEAYTPNNSTYHLLFNGNHGVPLWYGMGDGSIYSTDLNTESDITPLGISNGTQWDASLFNLIPVFNNSINTPYVSLQGAQCIDLPEFPPNTTCEAIRPYRSFLIALNIQDGASDQPNRLIWSNASDAGALPNSWDVADPETLAGDVYLTSSRGAIIDGLQLRDLFVIYKNHATYIMRLVTGQSVMQIEKINVNTGILAKNCVVELNGSHVILTDDDVKIFDGQSTKSIAEKRVKDRIQSTMDKDNFRNSFVVKYAQLNEIWVCWPSKGREYPNTAAVWNYNDNVWTFRDIGNARHLHSGVTAFKPRLKWADANMLWKDANFSWGAKSQSTVSDNLLKADAATLNYVDDGEDVLGNAMTCVLEKVSMDLGEPDKYKFITKVVPRITAKVGVTIYVQVGTQEDSYDQISWGTEVPFVVGEDRESSVLANGRFISVRFTTRDKGITWAIHGFNFKLKLGSRY